MDITEKDFGKDFSAQARDEWREVKLTNCWRSLTVKEWRTLRVQWEVAAMRVDDKSPELYWTKLGIHINPCKNWFVTWIDILLSDIERM
jgi:hypothetical protein